MDTRMTNIPNGIYKELYENIVECTSFDKGIINANDRFLNTYVALLESTEDTDIFTEKHQATIGEAMRIFISGIIGVLQQLKDAITEQIDSTIRSVQFKNKFNKLKEEVKQKKVNGDKTVEILDYAKITDEYVRMCDDLRSRVNKINNIDYLTHFGLDHDIKVFNEKINEYNNILEDLMTKKKKMKIDKAIEFLENETSGDGRVIKTLNNAISEFKSFENTVKRVETKEKIVGKELIAKNVIIVRQTSNGFVKFVRKWSSRIIARCVFWFA